MTFLIKSVQIVKKLLIYRLWSLNSQNTSGYFWLPPEKPETFPEKTQVLSFISPYRWFDKTFLPQKSWSHTTLPPVTEVFRIDMVELFFSSYDMNLQMELM